MKFFDLSPPTVPSASQQADALRKGLGRVMQWASQGQLSEAVLLEGCLHDLRYDMQVADRRGKWLWPMIQALRATERFQKPIFHALETFPDQRSALQLCELARYFAAAGDERFRTRLYEILEQQPVADWSALGEDEVVSLDGEAGFLFAARLRGRQLLTREWEWDDTALVQNSIDQFGEARIYELFSAPFDEALSRFELGWRQEAEQRAKRGPAARSNDRMRSTTPNDIIALARSGKAGAWQLRSWGMHADEDDLAIIEKQLWATESAPVLANLLRVFDNRALPRFDERLIDLCHHDDKLVRRRAYTALAKNSHPFVRRFALEHLERGAGRETVLLLTHNYEPGDEHRLLEALELPDDDDELHSLLFDATKLLEANSTADCSQLATIIYALTPCENCRFYALRLLSGQQAIPAWMQEECHFDSAEECRQLVGFNSA